MQVASVTVLVLVFAGEASLGWRSLPGTTCLVRLENGWDELVDLQVGDVLSYTCSMTSTELKAASKICKH